MVKITFILTLCIFLTGISMACDWCARKASLEIFANSDKMEEVTNFANRLGEMVITDCFTIGNDMPEYSFSINFRIFEEEGGALFSGLPR